MAAETEIFAWIARYDHTASADFIDRAGALRRADAANEPLTIMQNRPETLPARVIGELINVCHAATSKFAASPGPEMPQPKAMAVSALRQR